MDVQHRDPVHLFAAELIRRAIEEILKPDRHFIDPGIRPAGRKQQRRHCRKLSARGHFCVILHREYRRHMQTSRWLARLIPDMATFLSDLRYALRTLRRNPGLTALIVVSLAIGIGANTAIFSVVNALMLKPLPYPEPDRLAVLWLRSPGLGIMQDWPSPGQYIDIRDQNHVFQQIAISQGQGMTLTGREQPEHVEVLRTSSGLFPMLGAKPQLGRLLLSDEDAPGKTPVAVLSHAMWMRLYNGDRKVLNRTLLLNGNSFTIVGVLAPDFLLNHEIMQTIAGIDKMEIYVPLPLAADAVTKLRGAENYNLTARLKPGVTMAQAQADIAIIASRIRQQDHRSPTFTIGVVPLTEQVVGDVGTAVLVLFGSVGLVLAIACANVANLLLSRAAARDKEMAIRTALGARWTRLVGQLFTESAMLGILGGVGGLIVALVSLQVVRAMNPGNIPRLESIGIDPAVLAFTFGVSILTSVLFCAAPAGRAIRADVNSSLKSGGRSTNSDGGFSGARHRLRGLLVVVELAISLMLLMGAGLLIRSFSRLQEVQPGFNPDHVISMQLGRTPNPQLADSKARQRAYRRVYAHLMELPGVMRAAGTEVLPFTPSVGWGGISLDGYTPSPEQGELQVDIRGVTPGYFETMQVPIRQGRSFADQDVADDAPRTDHDRRKDGEAFLPQGRRDREARLVRPEGKVHNYRGGANREAVRSCGRYQNGDLLSFGRFRRLSCRAHAECPGKHDIGHRKRHPLSGPLHSGFQHQDHA